MKETIVAALRESAAVKTAIAGDERLLAQIEEAALELSRTVHRGGTVYLCGNGGSACDAMHFCEELVARFKRERPGFKAMHFMDPGTLTCWANDYSYDAVFQRCAETFCGPLDMLIVFSTSGNSKNVLKAVEAAKQRKCFVLGITGRDGGALRSAANLAIVAPASPTERIQEAHITLVHILCELLETR
jgi:phosphoheptose isomerase